MDIDIKNLRLDLCTQRVAEAFSGMYSIATLTRAEFITPEHMLLAIIRQNEFRSFCQKKRIDLEKIEKETQTYLSSLARESTDRPYEGLLSVMMLSLIQRIAEEQQTKHPISIPDILDYMLEIDGSLVQYLLIEYVIIRCQDGINDIKGEYANDIEDYELTSDDIYDDFPDDDSMFEESWQNNLTCINDIYSNRNPLIGREKELERTIRILCRKDKNNPLFIGEPGVGKTAMIYGLAAKIESGDVPEWLRGMKIYSLDMGSIVAGASYNGEYERRLKEILNGARDKGKCIIYIDEIHTIMGNGNNGNTMNAADILKPYLEDGRTRFIGSTTFQEYNRSIANNKAVARRFAHIEIKEPSVEEAKEIIKALLPHYEKHHGVKYKEDAVEYAVEQSDAFINDRYLPDKAIDIIDEAGALLQQHRLKNKAGKVMAQRFQIVSRDIVKKIFIDVCRIDAKALGNEGNEALKDLEGNITKEIYGQDEAVRMVVRAVMMAKAGLSEPEKPLASLLFVGPTGVGKTEVCKVLARELGIELIRFDMSEYAEKHTISKLIGSPAGYVGYDEGGLLTSAIRKSPNCVLLLDEIEKAHEDIYNILLQVMDYARLTDNKGNKANFHNVILIMTSNAGAQYAAQANVGFAGGMTKGDAMMNTVRKRFKPEFLNRLSATVVFNEMNRVMAERILDKKLEVLKGRMKERKAEMLLSAEAREFLLEKGFSERYGAREMDRVIQQYLTPLLMEEILFGKLKNGGTVSITRKTDVLSVE